MVNNEDNNDEYRFTDLDSPDNDMSEHHEIEQTAAAGVASEKPDIRRNAIIAIVLFVFAMILYKLIAHMMTDNKDEQAQAISAVPPTVQQVQAPITPLPVTPSPQANTQTSQESVELTKKVSDVEQSQISVRTEVSAMGQQVNTVNTNLNNLSNQIVALNQTVTNLTSQMAKQSEELEILRARAKSHPVKSVRHHTVAGKPIVYYVQAIIPGRAWLIGTNGSTLTVREGTKVPGYGVVKLIDSIQGKVVINSGRIIRFSQEDS